MATSASTVSNPPQNVVIKSINGSDFLVFKRALKIEGQNRDIAIRILNSNGNITSLFKKKALEEFAKVTGYYQQIIQDQSYSEDAAKRVKNLAISYQRTDRQEAVLGSVQENPLERLNECTSGNLGSFVQFNSPDKETIEATRNIFNLFLQGRMSPDASPVSSQPATPRSPSTPSLNPPSSNSSSSAASLLPPQQLNSNSNATALLPVTPPTVPNSASSSGATGLSSFSPISIATRFANSIINRFRKTPEPILLPQPEFPNDNTKPASVFVPTLPAPSQTNVPSAALTSSSPSILPQSPLVSGPHSPTVSPHSSRRRLDQKRPPALTLPNSHVNQQASAMSALPPGGGTLVPVHSPLSSPRQQINPFAYEMDILNLTPSTASPTPPVTPRAQRQPVRPLSLSCQEFVQAMDEVPSPIGNWRGLRYSHLTQKPTGVVDDKIIRARKAVSALISNPRNNEEEPTQIRNWMGRLTDRAAVNLPRDQAAAHVVRWMEAARSEYLPKGQTLDNLILNLRFNNLYY